MRSVTLNEVKGLWPDTEMFRYAQHDWNNEEDGK